MTLHDGLIQTAYDASTTTDEVLSGVDLSGKVAVVTGASSGLGQETARALAAAGARVIAPVRDEAAAAEKWEWDTAVEFLDGYDQGDFEKIAQIADQISQKVSEINYFIAAAGIMATPQKLVGPGWDQQFTVNHLGVFALTSRLYPLLTSGQARVVAYSSSGHFASDIRWDDIHFLEGYDKWVSYGQSKTANSLFARHLDTFGQSSGVRAFALHPGMIFTNLTRDIPEEELKEMGWLDADGNVTVPSLKTTEQGAATGVWAATTPELDGKGGLYLQDCQIASIVGRDESMEVGGVQEYALDPDKAARLWSLSAALTGTNISL